MKRVYWRPNRISQRVLLCLGLLVVGGTLAIERLPVQLTTTHQAEKLAAAELAQRGMRVIREARLEQGHHFDPRFDPAGSGMVGEAMSPVTSLPSHLDAKQTSVNPNFAAAVVDMLVAAGVESGDVVAVGYTGSFPAFNTCVCAALESLDLVPLVIHSAAASQFGANRPDMMWLDMETALNDAELISFRSHAATLGGFGDRARGMSDESKTLLRDSIIRNGVPLIEVASLDESIAGRMRIYSDCAAGRPIKAYINVGGGAASIHGSKGREVFGAGLTNTLALRRDDIDCVASRFATQGVSVIHIGNALQLAQQYGLPIAPQEMPKVGVGTVYAHTGPSRLLAGLLLGVVAVFLRTYLWSDLWARLAVRMRALRKQPEPHDTGLRIAATPHAELMV